MKRKFSHIVILKVVFDIIYIASGVVMFSVLLSNAMVTFGLS